MAEMYPFAFTPITIGGTTVLRPLLPVTIRYRSNEFQTNLLVDSGADYSLLRKDVVKFLEVDMGELKKMGETRGITGEPMPVGRIDCEVEVEYKGRSFKEDIPFQVILQDDTDPSENLLGRIPFFYHNRVDFRMGFTDDPMLGKFVIYRETKKRDSLRYRKPAGFRKQ